MKISILFTCLLLGLGKLSAQKQDSLLKVTPDIKNISTKTLNHNLIEQKLVQLQGTVKKLETTLIEAKVLMDALKKQKDALSELSEQDMLQLQQLMDQKTQLETMISNIMKAGSEAQGNIIKNLKTP